MHIKGFERILFPHADHGFYQPGNDFPGWSAGADLPDHIRGLLGLSMGTDPYVGAYPPE